MILCDLLFVGAMASGTLLRWVVGIRRMWQVIDSASNAPELDQDGRDYCGVFGCGRIYKHRKLVPVATFRSFMPYWRSLIDDSDAEWPSALLDKEVLKYEVKSRGGLKRKIQNEKLRIDTGCIVAFTPGLDYSIERAGNLKSMFFGGEGFSLRRSPAWEPFGCKACHSPAWLRCDCTASKKGAIIGYSRTTSLIFSSVNALLSISNIEQAAALLLLMKPLASIVKTPEVSCSSTDSR